MTGIHNRRPSSLDRVVLPAPARPVMMMHFGFVFTLLASNILFERPLMVTRHGC
jgi:hypothetical protein